jgi:hypothetical protein
MVDESRATCSVTAKNTSLFYPAVPHKKSMVPLFFARLIFDVVVGLPKSIRSHSWEIPPRSTMRVAPGNPKKALGSKSRFLRQVLRQASVPLRHQISAFAKPVG